MRRGNILEIGNDKIKGTVELKEGKVIFNFLGHEIIKEAPMPMKRLIKINRFNIETGCIEVEANTGEEYMDIGYLFEQLGLDYDKILKEAIKQ